jgi:hypothetical protein
LVIGLTHLEVSLIVSTQLAKTRGHIAEAAAQQQLQRGCSSSTCMFMLAAAVFAAELCVQRHVAARPKHRGSTAKQMQRARLAVD